MITRTIATTAAILACGLAAGGCTHLAAPAGEALAAQSREDLTNAKGDVLGIKEVARDPATGERITQLTLFIPRYQRGRLVGYEERLRGGGSILRDAHGKKIGGRFADLRSRKSLTIVVLQRDSEPFSAPSIEELVRLARLDE